MTADRYVTPDPPWTTRAIAALDRARRAGRALPDPHPTPIAVPRARVRIARQVAMMLGVDPASGRSAATRSAIPAGFPGFPVTSSACPTLWGARSRAWVADQR